MPKTKEEIRAYHREYKRKIREKLGKKPRRGKQKTVVITKEELEKLYITEGKSTYEIGLLFGLKSGTILKRMHEYGIPIYRHESLKVGDKFGDLEVISRWKDGSKTCIVRCRCNKEFNIRIDSLKKKTRLSCKDCAKKDCIYFYGNITKQYWHHIVYNSKKRNLEFTITPEYVNSIFNGKCRLSGLDIRFADSAYGDYLGETTASLDRIDSNKGYIEGNVQWVHKNINWMKQDFSEPEFIRMCCEVTDYHRKRD